MGHLDFEIVSTARCPVENFVLRISDFKLPDNSLPNMMIQSTKLCTCALMLLCTYALMPSALYICRASTTNVERALQISSFMQNKANFPDDPMNINKVITRNYENKTLGKRGKNKANSKPNKANFRKAKMNVTTFLTKDYENISNCSLAENKPNTNPIQTQTKPTCRGVASGEAGSEAKKCCSPPLCCGISKEKMISCNLINRKYQFNIIAVRMLNNKTI